jgi:hypothetical protein
MPTIGMARMRPFCRASPEAKILQTLSEESISPIDPNNIDRNCSTIRFCTTLVRPYVRLHQLDRQSREPIVMSTLSYLQDADK